MMSLFKRVNELEKKAEDLEKMVISLSQSVAELADIVDKHDQVVRNLPEHVGQLFNEVYQNATRELSAGIDQVLNFTPYGAK